MISGEGCFAQTRLDRRISSRNEFKLWLQLPFGIIHSIIGGRPLLILGVAEPTVLMYTFMFNFTRIGKTWAKSFLTMDWVGMCLDCILALLIGYFGSMSIINRFTHCRGALLVFLSPCFLCNKQLELAERHRCRLWSALMVVIWTGVSYIPSATMIAVLYYFDHSVASQLAQQKEFNFRKPSSFHYDLLLGFSATAQSLGSHSAEEYASKRKSWAIIWQHAKETYKQMQTPLIYQERAIRVRNWPPASSMHQWTSLFDIEKEIDDLLPEAKEQRLSNLLQLQWLGMRCRDALPEKRSQLQCFGDTLLSWPSKACLENQFWEKSAPFHSSKQAIQGFSKTIMPPLWKLYHSRPSLPSLSSKQPICFSALEQHGFNSWCSVSPHDHALGSYETIYFPKLFKGAHLSELDAEYEEYPAVPFEIATLIRVIYLKEIDGAVRRSCAECKILDELGTHEKPREIKHLNSPKVTSTSGTPAAELRNRYSPGITEKAHSPRGERA
ncbi:hypothetical protein HPP92_001191 [Vanilla planifolia]|uniref:Uncharacterized protein n=1 Tax=Vanilla planifolia TaxID=51239 RepID=A0A835RXP1_VANPL|nr:hypothetical protein HPP92_001191 [Vanilla planifolia]